MNTGQLFTGPWRVGDKGEAIIALKRIVGRAAPELLPWRVFDDLYNERLRAAVSKLQARHAISPATGNVGLPTFTMLVGLKREGHPTDPAPDATAVNLLEEAWGELHPPVSPVERVQLSISGYCEEMEAYNARWHYLQRRPFRSLGVAPVTGGYSDCSEFVTAALYWARRQTGVFVPDPNGRGYDGWGNSDTLYETNRSRTVSGLYEVGDIAVYGPASKTIHVTICREAGNAASAIFTSNGSESGPNPTRVTYWPSEFLAVVRPRLVP